MINCLEYALNYWNKNKNYKIYYNSDHCVNLPEGTKVSNFNPIEDFGLGYFEKWYTEQKLITKKAYELLKLYFSDVGKPSSLDKEYDYYVYTDGGCATHSHKEGNWAFCVIDDEENLIFENWEKLYDTTNSQTELNAFLNGLRYINENLSDKKVLVRCDSTYVVEGYNSWCNSWRKKDWKKANGQDVMYPEIWKEIDKIRSKNLFVEWVKGHSTDKWNNYCDRLTRK